MISSDVVRHVALRCISAVCAAALGAHGSPVRWIILALFAVTATGLVVIGISGVALLHRSRSRTFAYARAARSVGRPDRWLGIDGHRCSRQIVYSVAGHPPAIVVSEPTLAALTDLQLRAVLAHERAHLAGRHHLILGLGRALATAMPRLPLFTACAAELRRLVEMCADDAAARLHDVRALVTALRALAGPPVPPRRALAAATSGSQSARDAVSTGRPPLGPAPSGLPRSSSSAVCSPPRSSPWRRPRSASHDMGGLFPSL